jgi:hypothetical protein
LSQASPDYFETIVLDLLTRNVSSGNAMLRTLLAEPIRFTPIVEERRRAYRFEGRIALDRMIAGLVPSDDFGRKLHQLVSSPTGLGVALAEAAFRLEQSEHLERGHG